MASADDRKLQETPTWAVAVVCVVIVGISLLLEMFLHKAGHWFSKKKKASMVEVLEKIKAELMILGFISLLLTVGQDYISEICIPEHVADSMWPCRRKMKDKVEDGGKQRRLLWDDGTLLDVSSTRRFLAAPAGKDAPCSAIRGWKKWEKETESIDYKFWTDPSRFNVVQENAFVEQHVSCWNRIPVLLYITSFFRQLFRSVRKIDYLIIRHGFISNHLAPGREFNFQKYIKRSLEDDFKVVVGISLPLWASGILLLLLNVEGLHAMFWVSLLPLLILFAVGTKLQAIITKMAIEIHDKHAVVQGIPQVTLSDHHFWFGQPKFVLFLLHFTLFQNAFQLTYFLWIWNKFGLNSCYHENVPFLIARICLGVFVQILCSYVTLPLYALVSQLGTHMKRTIFEKHTSEALLRWQQHAKEHQGKGTGRSTRMPSASPDASPLHHSHGYNNVPHSTPTTGARRGGHHEVYEVSSREIETASQEAPLTRFLDKDIEFGSMAQRSRQ